MALITKICTVVWKSASSFQCVNQLPPPSLEQLFHPVIEVTAQAPKITASVASLPQQEGAVREWSWAEVCWCSSGDFEQQRIPWDASGP